MKKQKYFKKDLSHYVIIQVKNPQGETESWAKQLTYDEVQTVMYNDKYKLVKEESVEFEGFLINPDLDEEGYPDPIDDIPESEPDQSYQQRQSKLKAMLEGLKNPISHTQNTLGQAADILGMIRDRHETVEMPPTVVMNPKKYSDSAELEKAIDEMQQRHGTNATILVGTTPPIPAEDYLATLKNKETIGISSYPDKTKSLGVALDPEILEEIKKLRPKK